MFLNNRDGLWLQRKFDHCSTLKYGINVTQHTDGINTYPKYTEENKYRELK